jgi:hypothetical protein
VHLPDARQFVRPYRREERKPDPAREFFSEYQSRPPRPVRKPPPATVGPWCVFENGREVRRGYACPHYRELHE